MPSEEDPVKSRLEDQNQTFDSLPPITFATAASALCHNTVKSSPLVNKLHFKGRIFNDNDDISLNNFNARMVSTTNKKSVKLQRDDNSYVMS